MNDVLIRGFSLPGDPNTNYIIDTSDKADDKTVSLKFKEIDASIGTINADLDNLNEEDIAIRQDVNTINVNLVDLKNKHATDDEKTQTKLGEIDASIQLLQTSLETKADKEKHVIWKTNICTLPNANNAEGDMDRIVKRGSTTGNGWSGGGSSSYAGKYIVMNGFEGLDSESLVFISPVPNDDSSVFAYRDSLVQAVAQPGQQTDISSGIPIAPENGELAFYCYESLPQDRIKLNIVYSTKDA